MPVVCCTCAPVAAAAPGSGWQGQVQPSSRPAGRRFLRPSGTKRQRPCRPPPAAATAAADAGGRAAGAAAAGAWLLAAGPATPPPDYSAIDAQPLNRLVYGLFRNRMVQAIGTDSQLEGYAAIIDLTRRLNVMHGTPRGTQEATVALLRTLFPAWLPPAFAAMFARPLPGLSCQMNACPVPCPQMNAWATWLTCQWLMGECEVNDVEEIDGGGIGRGYGVLVKRCRYLEESGCASVCINSCKVPTQEFFGRHMGLALDMKPNYEDFSCQFSFGKMPMPQEDDAAFATPCFQKCPTARRAAADAGAEADRCHKIELSPP